MGYWKEYQEYYKENFCKSGFTGKNFEEHLAMKWQLERQARKLWSNALSK